MRGVSHFGHGRPSGGRVLDAFGRSDYDTHIEISDEHGDEAPEMPESGPSRTLLEMTLIDNHTGQALWHTRQVFPANPSKSNDVVEVVSRMLATLPRR
jgi:hypothetical protein